MLNAFSELGLGLCSFGRQLLLHLPDFLEVRNLITFLLPLDPFIKPDLSSDCVVESAFLSDGLISDGFAALAVLEDLLDLGLLIVLATLVLHFFKLLGLLIGKKGSSAGDCWLFAFHVGQSPLLAVFPHLLPELFLQFSLAETPLFLLESGDIIAHIQLSLKVKILQLRQNCQLV